MDLSGLIPFYLHKKERLAVKEEARAFSVQPLQITKSSWSVEGFIVKDGNKDRLLTYSDRGGERRVRFRIAQLDSPLAVYISHNNLPLQLLAFHPYDDQTLELKQNQSIKAHDAKIRAKVIDYLAVEPLMFHIGAELAEWMGFEKLVIPASYNNENLEWDGAQKLILQLQRIYDSWPSLLGFHKGEGSNWFASVAELKQRVAEIASVKDGFGKLDRDLRSASIPNYRENRLSRLRKRESKPTTGSSTHSESSPK